VVFLREFSVQGLPPLGSLGLEMLPPDHASRMERARLSLEGLSVGDAFGECYFMVPERAIVRIENRFLKPPPWSFTDDTVMALSVVDILERCGHVDQDDLATAFAARWVKEPGRGYGGTASSILSRISVSVPWREASSSAFNGMGSMGNGAAIRVAPIGAYFADDLEMVAV
jgi:ADP-ribosylglycohydrolase